MSEIENTYRTYKRWYTALPLAATKGVQGFSEPMSDKVAWMRLRQLVDVPSRGLALFAGSRPERNRLYLEFRNFVRQAHTYWEAAATTRGSASALLYYYSLLNLAKAELLQTNPAEIVGKQIHHGLSAKLSGPTSIRGDAVTAPRGVFPLLFEKRTGEALPVKMKFPIMNVLSLIPEIGHEMSQFGRTRGWSMPGLHTVAMDDTSAWSLIAIGVDLVSDKNEPTIRRLLGAYEPVAGDSNWRSLFAVSTRHSGRGLTFMQSKKVFSIDSPPQPDHDSAIRVLQDAVGGHLSTPLDMRAEFMLTYTLRKSSSFVLPLSLARYVATFYMSSLVRYKPASLDPQREGEQAWLADSFSAEVPTHMLAEAVENISGIPAYFDPAQHRV